MCLQNPPQSSVFTTNATEQIVRVYVLKTHHNLQFSPQMLHYKINEGMCLQNPTNHNLQFSPQMLQNQIDENLCLQNPPQSSVFTTNVTETDQ